MKVTPRQHEVLLAIDWRDRHDKPPNNWVDLRFLWRDLYPSRSSSGRAHLLSMLHALQHRHLVTVYPSGGYVCLRFPLGVDYADQHREDA